MSKVSKKSQIIFTMKVKRFYTLHYLQSHFDLSVRKDCPHSSLHIMPILRKIPRAKSNGMIRSENKFQNQLFQFCSNQYFAISLTHSCQRAKKTFKRFRIETFNFTKTFSTQYQYFKSHL